MKRVISAIGIMAALLAGTSSASAQTASAPAPVNAPSVNMGYAAVFGGIGAVKNVNALAGGEVGVRVYRNLDIFAEGGWAKDGTSRRRADVTASLATLLQNATGKAATSTIESPVYFGLGGLRYVFDVTNDFHAYVLAEAGRASIEYKPRYSLAGTDVTDTLATYGVTAGSDIFNKEAKAAFGGGVGIWYTHNSLFVDGSVRLLSIRTTDQPTNVMRAQIGAGIRF